MAKYVLALDQGTTSSRAILFDRDQNIIGSEQKEFAQIYPREGWVEHDPMEIFSSQYAVAAGLLAKKDISPGDIAAIGITNQRETAVVWDRRTGRPVYNAIVWQCRRTSGIVDDLVKNRNLGDYIRKTTGLVPDAYFSGTKIKWILDHVDGARDRARGGELLFGTVDTWLMWKLSGGAIHATDYTNASRTMIFDIRRLAWDRELLAALDIPREMLPAVYPSGHVYGNARIGGTEIPVAGVAGDQQAALFGQCCFDRGEAKNTYGTGCFLLMNTGDAARESGNGLLTTVAAGLETGGPDKGVQYALEGSVFVGGAAIQWLRDEMRFFTESADSEYFASKVNDTGGVYLVPAFTGLGAPYWDMYARGCIVGITRGTKRQHIIRAAEEAIAYQSMDLVRAMEKDTGTRLTELKVDGGACRDNFLMQFQADMINGNIRRPVIRETTALGAAYLAGLATGFWKSPGEVRAKWQCDMTFTPQMGEVRRAELAAGWHKAVGRSRDWAN
jgi:glycerol kinase